MCYKIDHRPYLDVEKLAEHFSERDGVDIKYVCTSSISTQSAYAFDIFFRDTPHPKYGNRYFGLITRVNEHDESILYISDADGIEDEDLNFGMVENNGILYYSRHRHDCFEIPDTNMYIDGGRAYIRGGGNPLPVFKNFILKDGNFVKTENVKD